VLSKSKGERQLKIGEVLGETIDVFIGSQQGKSPRKNPMNNLKYVQTIFK
jgi:uncharacterized protein (DUF2384 family)